MRHRITSLLGVFALMLALAAQAFGPELAAANGNGPRKQFVRRSGSELRLNGKPFRFAGTNQYYLMYKSPLMVDAMLEKAAASGFDVVRLWGSLEIGNQDGTNSVDGIKEGVYFQYWDPAQGRPAYNDGPDGLQRLDYVIAKAGELDLKLVIPFVNNWNAFGGMDQYVRWRGGQFHDEFYSDPLIRSWYKDWISHLLNRTNSYTGVKYKDDPTIMTWELGNEPRCLSAGAYPRSPNCSTETLVAWADEISRHVHALDKNHLISVGDEGFYCEPGAADWTENCNEGVDTLAFTRLKYIDVMSLHLYPDHWGKEPAWGIEWIERHVRDAKRLKKAVMLGEFGLLDKNTRNVVFKQWTDALLRSGGSGALYWLLSDVQDDGTLYPDFDGFTVYCPSPVCTTMSNFAAMQAREGFSFPPVADHDSVVTEFNTPASLTPAANDIAYNGAQVLASTIDLDPATPGDQTEVTTAAGSFTLSPGGTVSYTPADGFAGTARASYTIRDSRGRSSNLAELRVTVKPDPTAALQLFSFEAGTDGWAPANWQSNAGTTAQSGDFATDGASSLQVTTADGGWFGVDLAAPVDLSDKTSIKFDIRTGAVGTSQNLALRIGSGYSWCEGAWSWVNPGTTATVEIDLLSVSCAGQVSDVRSIFVFFSAGGSFHIDNVRAE